MDTSPLGLEKADYDFGDELLTGVYQKKLLEGRLLVITLRVFSRQVVDTWFNAVAAHITSWEPSHPYMCVNDFNAPNMVVSPYSTQKAVQLYALGRTKKEIYGRSGHLFPNTPAGQLMNLFVRKNATAHQERGFADRKAAIDWCAEAITIYAANKGITTS
jgi:hypothetical protein